MKTIFLLSKQEKLVLPKDLLIENVILVDDTDILNKVLTLDCQTFIFTKDSISGVARYDINSFVTAVTLFTDIKLIYLTTSKIKEDVEYTLNKYGNNNIYETTIETLTINKYKRIVSANLICDPVTAYKQKSLDTTKNMLTTVVTELKSVNKESLVQIISKNRNEISDLLVSYLKDIDELKATETAVKEYEDKIKILENSVKTMTDERTAIESENNYLNKQLSSLRRSILEHSDKVNIYNKLIKGQYSIKPEDYVVEVTSEYNPIIIYFKELEDIGVYDYYEALHYTLATVMKKYVKSIILENTGNNFYDPYTQYGYNAVQLEPDATTVIEFDKIVRYGEAYELLKFINRPEMKVDIIMIYDRTKTDTMHVMSDKLIPFYLAKRTKNITTLKIDGSNLLSPNEGDWQNIKPLLEMYPLDNNILTQYRIATLMHPLTKAIISFIETLE